MRQSVNCNWIWEWGQTNTIQNMKKPNKGLILVPAVCDVIALGNWSKSWVIILTKLIKTNKQTCFYITVNFQTSMACLCQTGIVCLLPKSMWCKWGQRFQLILMYSFSNWATIALSHKCIIGFFFFSRMNIHYPIMQCAETLVTNLDLAER